MRTTTIQATGSFIPVKRECNSELEDRLGLDSGWLISRTGIEHRAIADESEAVSDLAIRAAESAIRNLHSKDQKDEIGTLILATSTPDHLLPPTSSQVAHQLGLGSIPAMDLTVACSGFLYALILAESICQTRGGSTLIIAANILSRRCKPDDPSTTAIFSDAAGALILGASKNTNCILSSSWVSDGSRCDDLVIPHGGSRHPFDANTFSDHQHLMELSNGSSVFKYAVQTMAELGSEVVTDAGLKLEDVDWWIPHQANRRIIDAAQRILKIPPSKVLTTVEKIGNSSAATIPVTLDQFIHHRPVIKSGQIVLMTAAAAGMTGAAILVRIP